MPKQLKYQRLIKWLSSLLLVFVLLLLCLPLGIRQGIEYGLVRLGVGEATVEDVDFNPFLGRLVVRGVRAATEGATPLELARLSVEVSWWPLFNQRLLLEALEVEGLRLEIRQGADRSLQLAGMMFATTSQDTSATVTEGEKASSQLAWGFGLRHLHVADSDITYRSDPLLLNLQVDSWELSNLFSFAEGMLTTTSLNGRINGAPLSLDLSAMPFAEPRYAQGGIQLQALALSDFNKLLPPTVKSLKGQLGFDIHLNGSQGGDGDLKLDIQGKAALVKLGIQVPDQGLAIGHDRLSWQGLFKVARQAQQTTWQVEGDINSENSVLLQQVNGQQQPFFTVAAAGIHGLRINQVPMIEIDSIQLDSTRLQLTREQDGSLRLPGAPATSAAKQTETVAPPAEPAKQTVAGPVVRLRQLHIGGNSGLLFEDNSVSPPFKLNMQLSELRLEHIDNNRPDQATALKVSGKLDQFSSFKIEGKLYPFTEKLTLDLAGNIQSLDLPPLSSYTVPTLGYNLSSGHLDAELAFKVEQGVINSENQLKINQLTLDPSDKEKIAKFSKRLSMPLDAALSLLRDKQDNIELELPISGDMESPEFDVADAINQSVASAMRFAAMYYIKLALQPFGALVSIYQVADTAGKMVSSVRLDPVYFGAADSQLDAAATAYLATTIKLLQTRPQLNLRVCGKAIVAELDALLLKQDQQAARKKARAAQAKQGAEALSAEDRERLLALARERSVAVKNHLVKEGGIDAARLFICNPEINDKADATSRVELLI